MPSPTGFRRKHAELPTAPFVLGFSDDGTATACLVVTGVLHLLQTLATRFLRPLETASRG